LLAAHFCRRHQFSPRASFFAHIDRRFSAGAMEVESRDLNRRNRNSNPHLKKIVVYFSTTTTFFP
jgi:hypothetical protein